MREILFRGKRKDSGWWEVGDFVRHTTSDKVLHTFVNGFDYEVRPETVSQYTGLTDKNGKKIFEGDIMTFNAYGIDYVGTAEYAKDSFGVSCNGASPYLSVAVHTYNGEIIGNIHDNPELLGGADNGAN